MKIALTTTLDDKYVTGFLVTYSSILRTTTNLNYDLIIFEWGNLSEENKELIRKLCSNVIFKPVDKESYINQQHDDTWRVWTYNCNYRFDIFTLEEYDRVIFFDSDILFEINISELINESGDFSACMMPDYTEYNQIVGDKFFNAGLMSFSKKYLNKKTKQDLIDIANSEPPFSDKIKTNKWFGNQPILNNYFLDKITWIPQKFNFLTENLFENSFDELKNFHFIGHKKPWNGTKLAEQFDKHIFESVSKNINNLVFCRMALKKLIEKYNIEKEHLKTFGINI